MEDCRIVMKKYILIFKYKNDPWKTFVNLNDECDIAKMGGCEEVVIQSNDLKVIRQGYERAKYHTCGMSMIDILQL